MCTAMATTIDSLPRLNLYPEFFDDSRLMQNCVIGLSIAILQFWRRACKFYRRRRLWTLARSSWTDYEIEVSRLGLDMNRALRGAGVGTVAENMAASGLFRAEQRSCMLALRQAHDVALLEKDVFASLAPQGGDINEFAHEHEAICGRRHENTCQWILEHRLFISWLAAPPEKHTALWITAGPGAGKSTLTSFVIEHLRNVIRPSSELNVAFFYFKAPYPRLNNAADAMCSLTWQLCNQSEAARLAVMDKTQRHFDWFDPRGVDARVRAKENRISMASQQLGLALQAISDGVILVDGLDECQDCDVFLQKILGLFQKSNIKVLFASRQEEQIAQYLRHHPTLEIMPSDIQRDVEAFSAFKITRSTRLSHHLVRDKTLNALISGHDGVFLWVVLMLKELKACVTVEDVQSKLSRLPMGLEALYAAVVERLGKTLTRGVSEVTRKVLAWVLGSTRSLSMDELREAGDQEYRLAGNSLAAKGKFLYADQEIEVICGSLVKIQFGRIQPVHKTLIEFSRLVKEQNQVLSKPRILPDRRELSIGLTSVCLAYIAEKCGSPLTHFANGILDVRRLDMEQFRTQNAFIQYACANWAHYILECPEELRAGALALLESSLTCSTTSSWIEVSFLQEPRSLQRLKMTTEAVDDWVEEEPSSSKAESSGVAVDAWCASVLEFFNSYGSLLAERPWIVWFLRLKRFPNHEEDVRICNHCQFNLEEKGCVFEGSLVPASQIYKLPARAHLGHDNISLLKARLSFFVHEPRQNIFITREARIDEPEEQLFVQDAATGRRLQRVTVPTEAMGGLTAAKVSDNGEYLALSKSRSLSVWKINPNIRFSKRLRNREWAVRLFEREYPEEFQKLSTDSIAFVKGTIPAARAIYNVTTPAARATNNVTTPAAMPPNNMPFGHFPATRAINNVTTLLAPGGWYELPSPVFHTFGALHNQATSSASFHFSGDGEFIFTTMAHDGHTRINRMAVNALGNDVLEPLVLSIEPEWSFLASNTGRYLVLMRCGKMFGSINTEAKLLDVELQRTHDITSGMRHTGARSFHFTRDDNELVTFLLGPRLNFSRHANMQVSVWQLNIEVPKICSTGHLPAIVASHIATVGTGPVCTIDGVDRGWIVSCDRLIQDVRFSRSAVSFPGLVPSTDERDLWHTRLSHDASRLGNVKVAGSNICLQILNLCSKRSGDVIFEHQYKWSDEEPIPTSTPVALSPNLDLLVVGSKAFTVEADESSSRQIPIPLGDDFSFADYYAWERDWTWTCEISHCGSYVAFEKPSYKHHQDQYERKPARSVIIHVDTTTRVATRLWRQPTTHVSEGASEWLAVLLEEKDPGLFCFHPSMPLAAFSATTGSGNDNKHGDRREPNVLAMDSALAIMNLEDDTTVDIKSPSLQDSFHPRLRISDCGTFTYLDKAERQRSDTMTRLLVSKLDCAERRLVSISSKQAAHPNLSRCYELNVGPGATAIGLSMYTFTFDQTGVQFPQLQISVHCARIGALSFVPAELAWPMNVWLLLNQDYSQPLRLLLFPRDGRPPVLRTLVHSWNDVVKELESQYAKYIGSDAARTEQSA